MRYLKSLILFIYLAVFGVAIGLFERHQTRTYGHLARENARGNPQLHGQLLGELSAVLLDLFPDKAAPNVMMGKALADQGKLHSARRYLEKALEVDRRSEALLFVYARLLLDVGADPEEIRPIVDEIRRNYPRSRDKVKKYFTQASKGELSFED